VRILIVVSEAPPIVSGISRCVDRLTSGLRARGHTVDIISAVEIPRIMMGEIRLSAFGAYWPRIVRRLREYDLVNVHGPVPTMSDVFLLLHRGPGVGRRPRVVYTHHSAIDIDGLGGLCTVYNRMHNALARTADRIVVTSEAYRGFLATPGGPPVDVVPWGVDGVAPAPASPAVPTDVLRVLFVGQMRPYKGVDTLLRAVAGQRSLAATLVGSGPLLDRYRALASSLGTTNVTFAGHVDDAALGSRYGAHDVVVLPSTTRAEAFGLVLLEGMAHGCVPVASDLPGVREVATRTGFVVPPRDPEALRRVLGSLAADRERLSGLQRAARAAAAEMAWDRVVERYERTFQSTITGWQVRQAERYLPRSWTRRRLTLGGLAAEFDASWASLLLFHNGRTPALVGAWGRASLPRLHAEPPEVSAYIVRSGRPYLLDSECPDSTLRALLHRSDVVSAMSVPFPCADGTTGVVNLSLASDQPRTFLADNLDLLVGRLSTGRGAQPPRAARSLVGPAGARR
jgi:glycosyltransferase involved in cell wall biosynthesis